VTQAGKLTQMPFASLPLNGTELFYLVQNGISSKTTLDELAGLIGFDLTITDGTTAVANVSQILFVDATVSGVSPDGVVTISGGGAGIIPETGMGPIKISAFPDAPRFMGDDDILTGLQAGANVNFTRAQVLHGQNAYASGPGESLGIYGGDSDITGYGGAVTIVGGRPGGNNPDQYGGPITITGGVGYQASSGGFVHISGGATDNRYTNIGGVAKMTGGSAYNSLGGGVAAGGADSATHIAGNASLYGGSYNATGFGSAGGSGGPVRVAGGQGYGADYLGGDVTISPGVGVSGASSGVLILDNLPTADPHILDAVWNNSGVLTLSAG